LKNVHGLFLITFVIIINIIYQADLYMLSGTSINMRDPVTPVENGIRRGRVGRAASWEGRHNRYLCEII